MVDGCGVGAARFPLLLGFVVYKELRKVEEERDEMGPWCAPPVTPGLSSTAAPRARTQGSGEAQPPSSLCLFRTGGPGNQAKLFHPPLVNGKQGGMSDDTANDG